ncbi:helix-turn-helix domain-containing protein [Pseudonocardia acaciae]|uniref:helix-turn-helix domain-containing protein n=1 Tax=Pseudonocardia acaciae TaxID=551276 RepID=UPI00048B4473|nr:cupin domain-containing protein [Pseudonocardia acaciae]
MSAPSGPLPSDGADLGKRIRMLREHGGQSLRALAAAAGISPGFLSQVERGHANATVSTLRGIATALGLTTADLFGEDDLTASRVLRRDERPELPTGGRSKKYLLSRRPLRNLEVYNGELAVGEDTGEPYTHGEAQEMFLVIRGRVEVSVDGTEYELTDGDSIEYRTDLPHTARNLGDGVAEVLWIISPPHRP